MMTTALKAAGAILFLMAFSGAAATAWAAENVPIPQVATINLGQAADSAPDWIITLGVGTEFGPKYEGADEMGFSVLPSDLSIRRANEPAGFSAPDDGFDITLFEVGSFSVGPVGDFRFGRSRSDDSKLEGLRNVAPTLDAGLFAEYWALQDRLRTRIEIRQALHAGEGLVADLSADWVEVYGQFTASAGPRLSFGNGPYMRTNFGVSEDEAAASPFVGAFDPSSGIKSVGAMVALRYAFSPSWSGTIYDGFERLVGDAADSPITSQIGSRNQNTIGVSLSYSFGVKL
jgi:outer membrane protein